MISNFIWGININQEGGQKYEFQIKYTPLVPLLTIFLVSIEAIPYRPTVLLPRTRLT